MQMPLVTIERRLAERVLAARFYVSGIPVRSCITLIPASDEARPPIGWRDYEARYRPDGRVGLSVVLTDQF